MLHSSPAWNVLTCVPWTGIVRKKLGFAFLGETREEDRMLNAELELKGLSGDVGESSLSFLRAG